MTNEELTILAAKVSEGKASMAELALYNAACEAFQAEEISWPGMETDLLVMEKESLAQLWAEHPRKAERRIKLWPRIAVAAAAVAAITLGVWLYNISNTPRHPEFSSGSPLANDIAPGKNSATITLANGKTINLSDAKTGVVISDDKLAYNDGSTVANLSPSGRDAKGREGNNNSNPLSPQGRSLPEGERSRVQTLIASTPRGGTYQITLPDGTHVWLNADSKISFPSQFSGKERKILLSGEAYFEVSKDKIHPFIVQTDKQEVTVLGTHFNINAYNDEANTKTTLLEGSVRVAFGSPSGRDGAAREGNKNSSSPLSPQGGSLPEGERSIVLKPNQQATLAANNTINVKEVNVNEVIDWKNDEFLFKNEPLDQIMRRVARWYNIEVRYSNNINLKQTFGGRVSRKRNISEVLENMQATGKIKFKIEGRHVLVSK